MNNIRKALVYFFPTEKNVLNNIWFIYPDVLVAGTDIAVDWAYIYDQLVPGSVGFVAGNVKFITLITLHSPSFMYYIVYRFTTGVDLKTLKNEYLMFITLYMPVFWCKKNVPVYIAACDPLCFSNRSIFATVLSSCLYQIYISALPSITSTKFFLPREVLLKM